MSLTSYQAAPPRDLKCHKLGVRLFYAREFFSKVSSGDFPPLAGRERAELPRADGYADEPQCRVANRGGHPASLPVAAFGELEREPRRRNVFAFTKLVDG